ncbi:hypothetical protein OPKNFCMD_2727 [Methylobacterium crusticola]|uniref:Carboxymuconolactone decarboxylase-like domain-containing protein n=1 Tax=Methylobacterium crusticola TaxID=1697972 RepID=A0ABQ4QY67_9HYPH|nr:carboxymuconolactone decarboxylase family protein [Methylobacterium crusticola]GJD49991.1 hypothetical protein OPKNFCMD_2727 [Methylobacterium crusticola]
MSERLHAQSTVPAGMTALGRAHSYVAACGLGRLVDLVYLRVSQINGCAYCIDMHSRDLLKTGMPVETLVLVPAWREAGGLFDARERAALAWAEAVTRVAGTGVPDADYAAPAAVFDAKALADLTLAVALMNAYNRLGVAFRMTPAAVTRAA